MGSIPNGSAPLSSMRSPDLYTTLPGRTGKAQVRLAAAGRLRSAVALELVAGKVRAHPRHRPNARGNSPRNGTSSPCMGQEPRPSGRHRVPPRLRKDGSCFGVGPTRIPHQGAGSGPPFGKTERRARGLDFVARDNPADSLMPQGSTCWPYPHSTEPGLTRLGAGPHQAGRRRVIVGSTQVGHPSPRRDVRVRGARPLSASQAGFGLSTGGSPALQRQVGARADRCCAWSAAEGDSDGSHWDAAPAWRPTHVDPAVSVNLPAGQASGDLRGSRARLDPPRVRKVRPSGRPLPHASGPGWQERQVVKPVAMSGPWHTHSSTRMTGIDHTRPASRQSSAPHNLLHQQRISFFGGHPI
jgi:hypothetical protein